MQKTFLIFGLGNPGEKYSQTFHNAGYQVIEKIIPKNEFKENKKTNCLVAKIKKENDVFLLTKSLFFMNLQGITFKKTLSFYKIPEKQALIIQDDADLPLGTLRFSFANSSGGHKGIESIFQEIGHQNLYRLRLGIGKHQGKKPLKDFVLEKIPSKIQKDWSFVLEKASLATIYFCKNGYEKTASLFNKNLFL